ncbi:MAG: SycD/LcrH family type III secretion system chaperone [Kiritimatiellae bacterium]|nr:SycD/LcrH family type III secretion system chaperone [Kiritimatiellia bacterium]
MAQITQTEIAEAAKKFMDGATIKELKGITNDEMEAVYSLAFNYYRTGRYDEAEKLFNFLALFDHLNAKFWIGVGAVRQVKKDFSGAVQAYGYASFLDLNNPRPQLHAAECFLAMGDKRNAASSLEALDAYCPKDTEVGREYRAKAAELRKLIGEDAFAELAKDDEKTA